MIKDYLNMQKKMEEKLRKLDMKIVSDSEFISCFENKKGWKVILEGERYIRPAFSIKISYKDSKKYYLEVIMEIKSKNLQKNVMSFESQISFILNNSNSIFPIPEWCDKKYHSLMKKVKSC